MIATEPDLTDIIAATTYSMMLVTLLIKLV